ncbi:acyl-CoA synthetase family protein [Silvimonas sp. JCM 19000]
MSNTELDLSLGALAGADSLPLAWRDGHWIRRAQWRVDVARACALLQCVPPGDVALYDSDCYRASVWLLAAWHAGRCVILPADATPATAAQMRQRAVALLGEFTGADHCGWARSTSTVPLKPLDPAQRAVAVFTSGSTGEPLCIEKRLAQLNDEMQAQDSVFGATIPADALVVATVSQQHLYGLLFRVIWPLVSGRPFAAQALAFPEALTVAAAHVPQVLVSSPAFLKRLPDTLDWAAVASHHVAIFSSGGPLPAATSDQIRAQSGLAVREIFGSSETGGIAWRDQPSAAWTALPQVDVALSADGLLQLRSPYLPSMDWFVTADQAAFAADGTFRLLGRADRIAKIEEKRVSLTALETALSQTGWISESRVIVLPGERTELAAAVVLNAAGRAQAQALGHASLGRALREKLALRFDRVALPRRWRFVDALPQTSMSKVREQDIKALFDAPVPAARPRYPAITGVSQGADHVVLQLHIPPNAAHFAGHFVEQGVLPGVTQIDWAVHFGRQYFALPPRFCGMDAIKFQNVILPDAAVTLTLDYRVDKQQLNFSYVSALSAETTRAHSSGRMRFEAA